MTEKTETGLIVASEIDPVMIYTEGNFEPVLELIRKKANDFPKDLTTSKSRSEFGSMARKVSSSKVLIDNMGKELVVDIKAKSKKIDEVRKHIRDFCDNLRDEIREPLTTWEAEKKAEKDAAELKKLVAQEHETALIDNDLFNQRREVEKERAELDRKQREHEQEKRDEQIRNEAAAAATRQAEAKANEEKVGAARIEERKRVEDEYKKQEETKRELERIANVRHRKQVQNSILEALIKNGVECEAAEKMLKLIDAGSIPSIQIIY